jgi:cytochrome c-type biogenesis protein CcmE
VKRFRIAFAVALVVGGIAYMIVASSTAEGIVYRTATEIRSGMGADDYQLRLTGRVKEGTIEKNPSERRITFVVIDHDSAEMKSTYVGVVPDTFRDKSEVVVTGNYDKARDVFVANHLLAKCPSKYQGGYDTSLSEPGPPAR